MPRSAESKRHRYAPPDATSLQVLEHDFAVAIPVAAKQDEEPFTVGVQLFNWKTLQFQKPLPGKIWQEHVCELFRFDTERGATLQRCSDPTFRLLKEIPPSLRFYENTRSLPEAYTVGSVQTVSAREDAIAAIEQPGFAFQTKAVFESAESFSGLSNHAIDSPAANDEVGARRLPDVASVRKVTRKSPSEVEIITGNGGERALVLTDTYYPGWVASLDGKPVSIYRANGFFRGILLPPGEHHVQFKYSPISFQIGLALAGVMAAFLVVAAATATLKSGAAGKRSEEKLAAQ
jgi:hypothetical protein